MRRVSHTVGPRDAKPFDHRDDHRRRIEFQKLVAGRIDLDAEAVFEEGNQLEHAERVDQPAREQRSARIDLPAAYRSPEVRADERQDVLEDQQRVTFMTMPRGSVSQRRAGSVQAAEGMVGVRGFEPPAPCSQSRCATRLRHTPTPVDSTSGLRSGPQRRVRSNEGDR